LVAVAEAVGAGVERFRLVGGEVVRASGENGDAGCYGAKEKAGEMLRVVMNATGSSP
jgi:hypothetical protein